MGGTHEPKPIGRIIATLCVVLCGLMSTSLIPASKHVNIKSMVVPGSRGRVLRPQASRICNENREKINTLSLPQRQRRRQVVPGITLLALSTIAGPAPSTRKASADISKPKRTGLAIEEIRSILQEDFETRNSFASGDLSEDIYDDNCVFTDPIQVTNGLKTYIKGVQALFNPKLSKCRLLEPMTVTENGRIFARWEAEFVTNLPFSPKFKPYTGTTTYTVDKRGLVIDSFETWDKSVAAVSTSLHF